MVGQQRVGLGDVRLVGPRHEQLDRVPQTVEGAVDLGPEPATAATKRLSVLGASAVPLFFAPAAGMWARTAVESRISTSRSGSRRVAARAANRPAVAHRSNRRHWVFQFPRRSGRSRQAAPVGRAEAP